MTCFLAKQKTSKNFINKEKYNIIHSLWIYSMRVRRLSITCKSIKAFLSFVFYIFFHIININTPVRSVHGIRGNYELIKSIMRPITKASFSFEALFNLFLCVPILRSCRNLTATQMSTMISDASETIFNINIIIGQGVCVCM